MDNEVRQTRGAAARPSSPIAVLSYHQTSPTPRRGTPVRSLVLPPWRFGLQLRTLRLLGWQGLSMRDLEPYLLGEKTGKVFGITLDDGYVNNFEHALPLLRELGFTATAYIVSGQIGGTNVWDQPVGAPAVPLMDADHLRAWLAAGMEIGAHTRNHVNLCRCDDSTARDEIAGCKNDLERLLGTEVRSFAYPYGEHRADHAEMVRQAGYTSGTAIVSSRARAGDDLMRLPRISVHLYDRLPSFVARVTTNYEDWRMRRWDAQPTSRGYYVMGGGAGQGAAAH
ncbi:polysaccharide deacetylase family protein [Ramlibacter henchirensis]|uniref:Polysaccharide deacetylase family protein n=1 Tax=Ramlibacter henchirensis TaxID=204072 RepID=A0A4Z0BVT8_9BURK|nr:polysaccharide deacetylase family protein [Ramlibacter henchirensis]